MLSIMLIIPNLSLILMKRSINKYISYTVENIEK